MCAKYVPHWFIIIKYLICMPLLYAHIHGVMSTCHK